MTDVEPIHYLSATAVITPEGDRRLAFCNERMVYGVDSARYQVANYSDPTGVTCQPCLTAYATTYPTEYAAWRERFPMPAAYQVNPAEHPDVTAVRQMQAESHRAWLKRYVNDDTVDATALMFTLHKMTYEAARELATMAIRLHSDNDNEGKN